MAEQWHDAFVLHRRPWRETSLWLEVFTRDHGKVALLAKGARKGKRQSATYLQPFQPLKVRWRGKGDLKTLIGAEPCASLPALSGKGLYCGFYLNELLAYLTHRHDPHPRLFLRYQETLRVFANEKAMEACLRLFEMDLLMEIGYGLILDHEVKYQQSILPQARYRYEPDAGPCLDPQGNVCGITLLALADRQLDNPQVLREAKKLLRQVIDYRLEGRPLKSRALFQQLITQGNHET